MKIQSIVIKGSKYKIYFDNKYTEKYGNSSDGHINYDTKKIYIDVKLDSKRRKEVLLHELGHAIFAECSLYQVINSQVQEIVVDQFAIVFVDLFFKD